MPLKVPFLMVTVGGSRGPNEEVDGDFAATARTRSSHAIKQAKLNIIQRDRENVPNVRKVSYWRYVDKNFYPSVHHLNVVKYLADLAAGGSS
jgi:hypothetical protein